MTNPTQHIAATHLAVADAITAAASAGAIWGYFTNFLTPLAFLVLCLAATWYTIQITGSDQWRKFWAKRRNKHMAKMRRKYRSHGRKPKH